MAGPSPAELQQAVDQFPAPPDTEQFAEADALLNGTYTMIADSWYDTLQEYVEAYKSGTCLREDVLEHIESIPSFYLSDGAAPLRERKRQLIDAAEKTEVVTAVSQWYHQVRSLLADTPRDLTRFERMLHDFGYALAHVLFLGARTPEAVARRLRIAYQVVGVQIDETVRDGEAERTRFTCPYRDIAAEQRGDRWVCHEKLDRVDDGYVTYLGERGIDYQRPRACDNATQCHSTVARESPERKWPHMPPETVAAAMDIETPLLP
ncbi:hypothetical protein [Haloquadratum walsbyi]|jgi:hypothetical protein|uniref:Uncharacterized protein n=1 Tax=Haloquadratum walsbyi J07HQW2 TaxID=1238425 RepID=U1NCS9_9EURY|nr:hypothetical protein [Haloquadratum walsbyi]ERG94488.1 MAG: hypothetical protein J07HQW2_00922 [Haloquadratum walsbyi J07HQW2]